ncbi:MAG: RdgB/HAM1 family non-canonical purine NTP pyrophosphatase [Verrucomicrobiales bacterium]|nr:RdgB/HAM1 family non-canonical purine NTP pyrophosphatase [Verrucomicrobiales bacterium]
MTTLIVATHNQHKTEEIAAMLGEHFAPITDLTQQPNRDDHPAPEETGKTFEANALIKALDASARFPDATILADDSGLEVDALAGAPGVYSARYAGENASDADNRKKLLTVLDGNTQRSARFRCVLILVKNGKVLTTCDGTCEGRIATAESGDGGFGYDPLFIPEGYDESFGILPAETKNQLSHRGRALAKLKTALSIDN